MIENWQEGTRPAILSRYRWAMSSVSRVYRQKGKHNAKPEQVDHDGQEQDRQGTLAKMRFPLASVAVA